MIESGAKKNIVLKGIGVSPGIVSGKAFVLDYIDVKAPYFNLRSTGQVKEEIKRFRKALGLSRSQLLEIRRTLSQEKGLEPLFIMDAHIMMLKDNTLIQSTVEAIRDKKINAEWALMLTTEKYRKAFSRIEDEYLKARISDVEYVVQRILRNLAGREHETISEIREDVIIVSRDLSPADTVQMKMEKILGFATDIGGKTAHTAIVARSIGIPAVVGL